MKRIATLALLLLTAGALHSQAPTPSTVLPSLRALIDANSALLQSQKATLDTLQQLDQDAQQLKYFGKRG